MSPVYLVLLLLGGMPSGHAADIVVESIGVAHDLASEKPLYSETHCVTEDALTREVIYRDAGERLLAHKTLHYRTGLTTPSYLQRNFHAGDAVAVELRQDRIDMTVSDLSGEGETVTAILDADMPLVIDAGFDAFVTDNWQALVSGQVLRFQFPLADRDSLFALRISSSTCTYDTATDQCFRLALDNFILRALLDPIELGYDASQKRLARYRGLSNIGDGSGDGLIVDIRYRYDDLPAAACAMRETPVAAALDTDIPLAAGRL